jgi:large subunit ribosomal protein L35
MPKLKTKKTLMKRIKITKTGKIMKKSTAIGHLKRKWDASKHSRKTNTSIQLNRGHQIKFKKLLGKAGKNIK